MAPVSAQWQQENISARLPTANDNSIIQQRIANQCNFLAQVFATVAELRDQQIAPEIVVKAIQSAGDELPDDIKSHAEDIVAIVYGVLATNKPEEIGAMVFGQCYSHNTGVRRQS